MGDHERIRLVTLGAPQVGKSAIIKRFLFNTFTEKYKQTVEDLYNQEYDFGPMVLKVDILDTSGSQEFPAMRRISIATAHAFLLVYAINNLASFELIQSLIEEIKEQRADYNDIPIVVVGNKIDLDESQRQVDLDHVSDWLDVEWPLLRVRAAECSAKVDDSHTLRHVFGNFLQLSKLPFEDDDSGLRRRSSAHAGTKASSMSQSPSTSHQYQQQQQQQQQTPLLCTTPTSPPPPITPTNSRRTTPTKGPTSPPPVYQQFLTEDSAYANKVKPRSRSLIRRSSKKAKQAVRDASGGPGDCATV